MPFVLQEERDRLREELAGKFLSVLFDGTTRLGEVLAVVERFISGWTIQQWLVRLEFLTQSIGGNTRTYQCALCHTWCGFAQTPGCNA